MPVGTSETAVHKNVLLVAYHFPPSSGSSGIQRTLRFAQYLPQFGWRPTVLTVKPSAYESTDAGSLSSIPVGCEVVRTGCLDAGRQLSILGRYPGFAAIPDRWSSWRLWAIRTGRRLVAERGIDAIWSTYPIATAHMIGAALGRSTGLPWVADFRDPMAQEGYPADPRCWQAFKSIEESAASEAARMVFVSPSALETYRKRYPGTPPDRFALIANGFDEESFFGLTERPGNALRDPGRPPVLLHSGIVYPSERNPTALFDALAHLSRNRRIEPGDFVIRFRAAVHENMLRNLATSRRVEAFVDIQPSIPYRDALQEMLDAEALVVLQGANCNEQIPAKLYEYLRAGRPILGLADPAGDTARTLRELNHTHLAKLESTEAIVQVLPEFVTALRAGTLPVSARNEIDRYSRRSLAGRLAALLEAVTTERMAVAG